MILLKRVLMCAGQTVPTDIWLLSVLTSSYMLRTCTCCRSDSRSISRPHGAHTD